MREVRIILWSDCIRSFIEAAWKKFAWVEKSYIGIYKFTLCLLDNHCACLVVASFACLCSKFEFVLDVRASRARIREQVRWSWLHAVL